MKLKTLHDVYVHELKDIYSAEKQIVEALPQMAKNATDEELKKAFSDHLEKSRAHLDHVQSLLQSLDANPGNSKCEGMAGLLKEGESVINTAGNATAKDAALIAAAQRVEHYEMAAYGCARTYAGLLGYTDHQRLLQSILNEEGAADKHLTSLAQGGFLTTGINQEAME